MRMPSITVKEKAFFAPFNHGRVIGLIEAGKSPSRLKEIPPTYLNIDITWRCNYDCIGCIDGGVVGRAEIIKGSSKDMDWEIVQDLLEYAKNNALLGFIVQGGEPLLYPRIDEFLRVCAEYSLILRLVTNGSQLLCHADALVAAFEQIRSTIRVSINADEEHYVGFTRRPSGDYKTVLEGIERVARGGAWIMVATVVFGRNLEAKGFVSNIAQLENIVRGVRATGAGALVFLPGRHPLTKEMIPFEKDEQELINGLLNEGEGTKVVLGGRFSIEKEMPAREQNKDYAPCPTALSRIVVGSDGMLFNCTEHRGIEEAIIGKVSRTKRFAEVWHSEERVRRQIQFDPREHCKNITCDRQGINTTVESARVGYDKFRCPSIIAHLLRGELEEDVSPFF